MVGLIQLTKRRNNFTDAAGHVLAVRADRAAGLAAERPELPADRGGAAPLGRRGADVRECLVGQRGQELGRREFPHPGQRDALRPRAAAALGKAAKAGKAATKPTGTALPLSSFRWNEVIFRSFQCGNLKQLDLEFYLELRLPTTKRMFRFLDKRFYRRDAARFRSEDARLRAHRPEPVVQADRAEAAAQAGARGAGGARLPGAPGPEERYSFVRARDRGGSPVHSGPLRAATTGPAKPRAETAALVEALTARGVDREGRRRARRRRTRPSRIRTKLEVFDWLVQNEDKRVAKNPAGYLVASIRADYAAPAATPPRPPPPHRREAEPSPRPRPTAASAEEEAAATPPPPAEDRPPPRWDALPPAQRDASPPRSRPSTPA